MRWYEQVGLLERVERDAFGNRQYTRVELRRLTMLMRLRTTGMPVSEMRRYTSLARASIAREV